MQEIKVLTWLPRFLHKVSGIILVVITAGIDEIIVWLAKRSKRQSRGAKVRMLATLASTSWLGDPDLLADIPVRDPSAIKIILVCDPEGSWGGTALREEDFRRSWTHEVYPGTTDIETREVTPGFVCFENQFVPTRVAG